MVMRVVAGLVLALVVSTLPAAAQGGGEELPEFDGPPAPVAPAVINRDAEGRVTVRAVRLSQPINLDGALDEAVYREVPAISDWVQIEPRPGEPATEKMEMWVTFDDDNVYVSSRVWDTEMDKLVSTELRRDSGNIWSGNDTVLILFDTFFDRRNAFVVNFNPSGGRQDGQVSNERQYNGDFNPVWELQTGRFDGGWTFEAAYPFKSLRYRPGRNQVWGFQAERIKPSKNEITFLTRMPPARGKSAYQQISLAATLVGIEAPPPARNLEIKPYVISDLNTDTTVRPRISNDPSADVGFDVKYGVAQALTADFTYNTDFAQVEADQNQVNLTRFSLFFPEKRDFFLESAGIFSFGGVAPNAGGDAPGLFYSRRIGLDRGQPVPITAGGRLTGRVGGFTVGAVNIQTGDEDRTGAPSTNYSVLRLKRDVLQRSSVGVLMTNRSVAQSGIGSSATVGVDGMFAFFDNTIVNTYWAKTDTEGLSDDDTSYRAQLDYPGDRYGVALDRIMIGDNFNPEVGFVRRDNMVRDYAQLRFSPRVNTTRPLSRRLRKFFYQGSFEHITDTDGRLESRERSGEFALEFQNADRFSVTYTNVFEFLPRQFAISRGVVLPVGGYDFDHVQVAFNMGQQRRHSFNVAADYGTFYNGHKTTLSVGRGRMAITNQLAIEPTYTFNKVDLLQGEFTTHLPGTRVTYMMTPLMFTSALVQYSSSSNAVSANVRLRWEYAPGSEFFVVYNESRDTRFAGFPEMTNRALIVKINRLFRF